MGAQTLDSIQDAVGENVEELQAQKDKVRGLLWSVQLVTILNLFLLFVPSLWSFHADVCA